jgi:hypothetical protein
MCRFNACKSNKATEDRSKKEVGNKTGVETRKLQAVNPINQTS